MSGAEKGRTVGRLRRLAAAMLLAAWLNGVAPCQAPPAPDTLSAKELYEEAKYREGRWELQEASRLYGEVVAKHPDSEWAKLAAERKRTVDQLAAGSAAGAGRAVGLGGVLLSLLGSCFSLMFLASWVLFFAYRGGWLWQSTIGAKIGDPISGFLERFRSRKKLGRELEARKLNPRDARSRHNLGVMYYQGRRYQQALDELAESVAIDPDRTDAQYFYGLTLLKLNRPAEAIPPLERVVAAKPRHGGDAIVRLAEAKLAVGDSEEAERLALQAAHGAPSDAESRYVLAVALDAVGKPEEVPRLLNEAIQLGRAHRGARRREALAAARKARAYLRSRKA
ncbi:MAG: tetratricopeptide repeat protein [Armatimonadetes bacterium]|nr:tetratricopeptide repeat protein [Armatimonadota bacterium]